MYDLFNEFIGVLPLRYQFLIPISIMVLIILLLIIICRFLGGKL